MWACVLSPYKNILSERMHALPLGVNNTFQLSKCDVYVQHQILGHHKFLSDKYAHSNVTYTDGVHENLDPPVATKRWMVGAARNKAAVPRNCLFPVIPHSCSKGDGQICVDRAAVHHSTFWQRPFSAQHSRLFKWNLKLVKGPISH